MLAGTTKCVPLWGLLVTPQTSSCSVLKGTLFRIDNRGKNCLTSSCGAPPLKDGRPADRPAMLPTLSSLLVARLPRPSDAYYQARHPQRQLVRAGLDHSCIAVRFRVSQPWRTRSAPSPGCGYKDQFANEQLNGPRGDGRNCKCETECGESERDMPGALSTPWAQGTLTSHEH